MRKTVGYEQASGTEPVNKVIVEGLFTEQSSSVQWAKRQRVLKSRSQKTRLRERERERDEWNCLSCFFFFFAQLSGLEFLPTYFFQFRWMQPLWQWKEAWQVQHTREQKERKWDPELWQGLYLNRPTMLCNHLPAACAFSGKNRPERPLHLLARPAVPDILSTVADPAVKVYICFWRNGCNAR